MYKRDSYIWVTPDSNTAGGSADDLDTTTPNIDPPINGVDRNTEAPAEQQMTHKPYVPPTNITVENAGRIKGLEAPLG